MLEELAELGYEYVELGHGIRYSLWPGVCLAIREGVVKVSSLHNFCPLPIGFRRANPNAYEFTDPDEFRRQKAVELSKDTIRNAAKMEAKAVVLHLGSVRLKDRWGRSYGSRFLRKLYRAGKLLKRPYTQAKLAMVREHERQFEISRGWIIEALKELSEEADKCGVHLGLESREAVDEVPLEEHWEKLLEEVPETCGYWHDFGHSAQKQALFFSDHYKQFAKRAGRLLGCHVQDFLPPSDDHRELGYGNIPFQSFWACLEKVPRPAGYPDPVYVLELSPAVETDEVKTCLNWWKNKGPQTGTPEETPMTRKAGTGGSTSA